MARLTNPAFVELNLNLEMALNIGPTTWDNFSDEDLRVGWEHHRERLMAQGVDVPGRRPWGWWFFEAERDEHLTPYPLDPEGSVEERSKAIDAYYREPVVWLAEHGHLRDDEIAAIAERANEAKLRVGTDAERTGSGGVDRPDRRAVELYEAVKGALKA